MRTRAQDIQVVGFGWRLAAASIDGLIILFFTFGISLSVLLLLGNLNIYVADESLPVESVVFICGLIFSFLYYGNMVGN